MIGNLLFYEMLSRGKIPAYYANNIDKNLSNKCILIEAKEGEGEVMRKVKYIEEIRRN